MNYQEMKNKVDEIEGTQGDIRTLSALAENEIQSAQFYTHSGRSIQVYVFADGWGKDMMKVIKANAQLYALDLSRKIKELEA